MAFETNKRPVGHQKRKGVYPTPPELARYLSAWALSDIIPKRILEPGAGDGNVVIACLEQMYRQNRRDADVEIVAVEIDHQSIERGKERVRSLVESHGIRNDVTWMEGDFFDLYGTLKTHDRFDVVLGNPPFIRFHHFDAKSRSAAFAHLREAGYAPTKRSNVWAAFLQLSIELLREGGRLAMVAPAEILQVHYAAQIRSRLVTQFDHIILVGFKKLVFPEIQQEVLLLLAEGKRDVLGQLSDIHTVECENGDELIHHGALARRIARMPGKRPRIRDGMKWTSLFLSDRSFRILDQAERSPGVVRLGELASVDVGIETGRNSFFILTKEMRKKLGVEDHTIPVIGRTSLLRSTAFRNSDYEKYAERFPSYLLTLSGVDEQYFPAGLKEYIASGEREHVHLGFKCRNRRRWFDIPSIYIPDGFLCRRIHRFPLFVLNYAQVTSTDAIYRVRFKKGVRGDVLAASFFNSLTFAWAEVCGRSYGGGVLELEPGEVEALPIPYDAQLSLDIEKLDNLLRRGSRAEAMDYVDGVVLKKTSWFRDKNDSSDSHRLA